jgi:hypothetical protein
MKIVIESIAHSKQAYDTCGDYVRDAEGTLHILVSETGNDIFNSLIGFHEWIEVMLMERRGIPLQASTDFDLIFEKEREEGKHSDDAEPGDDKNCVYKREHLFASGMELTLASALNVDLKDYEDSIKKL